jgi:CRISPR-associated protein Csb1
VAGRTALAALGLYAVALQHRGGYFLRSRCHLVPLEPPRLELLGTTAAEAATFGMTADSAREVFEQASRAAEDAGLKWHAGLIELAPTAKLVELVRRSDAKVQAREGDDDAGA